MLNIYRASAGSGKTFQLTKDYISLLFDAYLKNNNPRPHRRILAVTFTNKATDEMKSRILKELHLLSTGQKSDYRKELIERFSQNESEINSLAKKILISILHDYSSFSISTIDKFFQQVVRSFAREIGVSGSYNIELDTNLTLQQALENMYSDLSKEDNKQLLEWMTNFLQEQINEGKTRFVDRAILSFGKELFSENYQYKVREVKTLLDNKEFLKSYRGKLRKIKRDFEGKISDKADELLIFLISHNLQPEFFTRNMMFKTLENFKLNEFAYGSIFSKYAQEAEYCYTKKERAEVKNAIDTIYHNGLQERLTEIIALIDTGLPDYNSAKIILDNIDTLGILADLNSQISKLTSEQNIMLISNTNMLLNQIIDESDTPFVYERTGVNIDHYMIDEFQDTSVLQWKNFRPLVENSLAANHTNMVVGDVKQSIYRWRNSDWKLLDEQITLDFPNYVKENSLTTNWRSDKNIIFFNNTLFETCSEILQNKLNNELELALATHPELKQATEKISNAYKDVKQTPSAKAGVGYVRLEHVDKERLKADTQEKIFSLLPPLLEDLVERGYKHSDIAFLVRYKAEAQSLIEFLLRYKKSPDAKPGFSYDIIGNEGLKLNASNSINFIIAVLSLILNPKDDVSRLNMLYEYQLGKKKLNFDDSAARSIDRNTEKTSAQSALFTDEENSCIDLISHLPLYEAVEKLISTFKIEEWHHETVFLQAFQDVIYNFTTNKNADLYSFINWWKENGADLDIATPENEQAFRVLTVHKAKGLDFKVVIVPFGNWEMNRTGKSMLWCETDIEPYSELPLLPVKYKKDLAVSIFSKDYFEEMMHQYIDNLNIAYVAFTRARNEMYIFAETPSATTLKNLSTISDLMYSSLSEKDEVVEYWNEEKSVLEIGTPTQAVYDKKKSEITSKTLKSYPITDSGERLKIKHASADYWKTAPISESRVNYGTIMHEILQKTIRPGDEKRAIAELISAGKITENDMQEIDKELERFWSLPEVKDWFSDELKILNESTILLPSGIMYRSDRVILNKNQAIVIDYKFGEEERTFYNRQIKNYISFLKEMGYENVEGKIYYVSLGKIVNYPLTP